MQLEPPKTLAEYKRRAENVIRKLHGQGPMSAPKPVIEYNREGESRYRWVENVSDGLRVYPVHALPGSLTDRDEVPNIKHKGWYLSDHFQDETVHGVVVQLPGHAGQPRFMPGVSDPCNEDCALVDFTAQGDLADVVRWADRMAERYAQEARDSEPEEEEEECGLTS